MSQSIVLVLPSASTLSIIKERLLVKWNVSDFLLPSGGTAVQVIANLTSPHFQSYVTFIELTPQKDVEDDYKECDFLDPEFTSSLQGHLFYQVSFDDATLCTSVVNTLLANEADIKKCWVDNGYGKVVRGDTALILPPECGKVYFTN